VVGFVVLVPLPFQTMFERKKNINGAVLVSSFVGVDLKFNPGIA
jgi:hypothetical protein